MIILFTSIFQIANNDFIIIQSNKHEKNHDILNDASSGSSSIIIGWDIKNLSIRIKLTKSKTSNLAMTQKPSLIKPRNLDSIRTNLSRIDFLTFGVK